MSEDLPRGWSAAPIGELAEARMGETILAKQLTPTGTPVYSAGQANAPWGFLETPRKPLHRGTVIISARGSIGFPKIPKEDRFASTQTTISLKFGERTLSEYTCQWLKTVDWASLTKGGAIPMLTVGDISILNVPIAPLAEQRRIVAKLEVLLGKVDACRARLDKIPVLLKRFRQSVLAAACSGRLTADWRQRHSDLQSVSELLPILRKRREREANTSAMIRRIGETFAIEEENQSDSLPETWCFIALSKLATSFDYGTSSKSQPSGKIPVLRMGNIQGGQIDWSDLVYTSDAREIRDYELQPNTVLFNRTNSPELVGKTAIYRGERPAIFAGYLIRINPVQELNPFYLNACLNTTYAREFCQRMKTDGVSQSNVNAQKLGLFEVPLPPLSEQEEIVRRVEALFAVADAIEARFQKAKAQVEKLTPSLLAKAFRGELVPQDPNDEPASVLLERIRGQAPSTGPRKRRRDS